DTVARLEPLQCGLPLLVCHDNHRFNVAGQLKELGLEHGTIVLEPVSRNTAPAVAVAALESLTLADDPILLVQPSDHVIADQAAFEIAVQRARAAAGMGRLVLFGVVPDGPETGYGYISRGHEITEGLHAVEAFVEKPDLATAKKYLESGRYLWNSGMFVFGARRYLEELQKFNPLMHECCVTAHANLERDLDFARLPSEPLEKCPKDSVDYAVLEKTSAAAVVELDASWNDVGSWSELWKTGPQDPQGNVTFGDVLAVDSRDTYIHSSHALVSAVGVENLVIVHTPDALLVADRKQVDKVRNVVAWLKDNQRYQSEHHRKVYRPWGSYDTVEVGEGFQVKRITVSPAARLSLQLHEHRAEHWIVVSGVARVTRDDEVFTLHPQQSTFIPAHTRHRLENPGEVPLEVIEVQTGSYLGEDDIVRFEDDFNRESSDP
ncbi:MAG: mannose-1-phosphate guanylyltransferase/mannose-6-phosphate isomerase, partial [Arenicellales bacterium]|nr:mannose-1-phosphate guanylyltransferase/mannose-6-phosphate isomerase [Arenicellales bacterium]